MPLAIPNIKHLFTWRASSAGSPSSPVAGADRPDKGKKNQVIWVSPPSGGQPVETTLPELQSGALERRLLHKTMRKEKAPDSQEARENQDLPSLAIYPVESRPILAYHGDVNRRIETSTDREYLQAQLEMVKTSLGHSGNREAWTLQGAEARLRTRYNLRDSRKVEIPESLVSQEVRDHSDECLQASFGYQSEFKTKIAIERRLQQLLSLQESRP